MHSGRARCDDPLAPPATHLNVPCAHCSVNMAPEGDKWGRPTTNVQGTSKLKSCAHCSMIETARGKHKVCPCKQAWYCSKECQKEGWPAHKALCKAARQRENSAE